MTPQRIALTTGEPAGIGPDLTVLAAQSERDYEMVAIGDATLLQQRARELHLTLNCQPYDPRLPRCQQAPGELTVLHVPLATTAQAGKLDKSNAAYVLRTLDIAIALCLRNELAAMVTAPVHKGVINDAGIAFSGHTEYLADKTGTEQVVMMLATERLRVALATTHLPLRDVADAISQPLLMRVLQVLNHDLKNAFGIAAPRILVAGLNPHAGEGGHLGREEIDIIEPALQAMRTQGMQLIGPLPADTLFTAKYLDNADAVLAMYHDQGLPVLKYQGFGRAANITLGLPIIRTSVDHGTALDLAGSGNIDIGSLGAALAVARQMVLARCSALSSTPSTTTPHGAS